MEVQILLGVKLHKSCWCVISSLATTWAMVEIHFDLFLLVGWQAFPLHACTCTLYKKELSYAIYINTYHISYLFYVNSTNNDDVTGLITINSIAMLRICVKIRPSITTTNGVGASFQGWQLRGIPCEGICREAGTCGNWRSWRSLGEIMVKAVGFLWKIYGNPWWNPWRICHKLKKSMVKYMGGFFGQKWWKFLWTHVPLKWNIYEKS